MISLAEYIIVITERELKGKVLGHAIWRATKFDTLPIEPNASVSHPAHPVEAHLLALVKSHLNDAIFLYSYTFDITRRLQAQWVARYRDEGKASWEVVRHSLLRWLIERAAEALAACIRCANASLLPARLACRRSLGAQPQALGIGALGRTG